MQAIEVTGVGLVMQFGDQLRGKLASIGLVRCFTLAALSLVSACTKPPPPVQPAPPPNPPTSEEIQASAKRPTTPPTITTGGARKSAETLLSPPRQLAAAKANKGRRGQPKLSSTAINETARAAERERLRAYAVLERRASKEQRQALFRIRRGIAMGKQSFRVGITSVADEPLTEILGDGPPRLDPDLLDAAKQARASLRVKPNLLMETRVLRAKPPQWTNTPERRFGPSVSEDALAAAPRAGRRAAVRVTELSPPGSAYEARFSWKDWSPAVEFDVQPSSPPQYVSETTPASPSVDEIKAALIAHGPVVAYLHASEAYKYYAGGVFDEQSEEAPNHEIVIVGWDDALGAWQVREAWGPSWGEEGFAWIKYGSNAVGRWATWFDTSLRSAEAPGTQRFADRFVGVANRAEEPLKVFLQAEVDDGAGFSWAPGTPEPDGVTYSFSIAPKTMVVFKRPDTNTFLRARRLRIWAESEDGEWQWSRYHDVDLNVASGHYVAEARQAFVLPLQKDTSAVLEPSEMLAQAHKLFAQGEFVDARRSFDLLAHRFPDDPRAHEARFWKAQSDLALGAYADAVYDQYAMLGGSPNGHPLNAYALYLQGVAYGELGECGQAVRNFEAASHGEAALPQAWMDAAGQQITQLLEDDGALCASWK